MTPARAVQGENDFMRSGEGARVKTGLARRLHSLYLHNIR